MKTTFVKGIGMLTKALQNTSRKKLCAFLLYSTLLRGAAAFAQAEEAKTVHLTLAQAISLALKDNKSVKLSQLNIRETEHKKEIARSNYFPKIKNESAILHVTELAGVEIPAGAFSSTGPSGLIPNRNLFIGQGASTSYTSGTGLAQPLTQMFKIRESNKAATADINTAKIQSSEVENGIALKVRQVYDEILIAQLKKHAAEEQVVAGQFKNIEAKDAISNGRALDVAALESSAALLEAKQAVLTQTLQLRNLTLALNDLVGLPLNTVLELDENVSVADVAVPTKDEVVRVALENSPEVCAARQAVVKARAGLAAAKDAYIPDVTGLARYSYQSGVPLLVHNFGTFGFSFTYDLFDGGRREAELRSSRTVLAQAELNLTRVEDEVSVGVQTAYNKIEQLEGMVSVAQEAMQVRSELARISDKQFEQNAALASVQADAKAKSSLAKASYLEATLGLTLARADLQRQIGLLVR